jgi:SpoIID/LytB domain protein
MTYSGEICDTRFSKCCGGVSEEFEHCWQDHHYPYLEAVRDSKDDIVTDLTKEDEARKWILSSPDAFCNTRNKEVLGAILNDYDQETTDFYRWSVRYTRQELSELIQRKSGKDLGEITELTPLSRGKSGRIDRLRITGSKGSHIFGKELEIRRILSETHLYSSAFIVETHKEGESGLPSSFTFRGAGWGHGVGLCQIGAAVMSYEGYDYRQILEHYFKGASLEKLY